MSEPSPAPMTVDDFLLWAEVQSGQHELVDGCVHAMAPERVGHAEAKFAVQTALKDAIRRAALPCRMLPDGMTVQVDARTPYEPDALVSSGPLRLDPPGLDLTVEALLDQG